MLNFSRWTPTLGVCFKWDSQKVLKIAHIGIFRHIGGVRWVRKITDIKILWVKVLRAKNGEFSTTRGWEINFFRQNIAMFDWLCTKTYVYVLSLCKYIVKSGRKKYKFEDPVLPLLHNNEERFDNKGRVRLTGSDEFSEKFRTGGGGSFSIQKFILQNFDL